MNGVDHCRSSVGQVAFKLPKDQVGNSILTGTKEDFTCTEIEVFTIGS